MSSSTLAEPIQRLNPGPRYSDGAVHAGVVWLAGQVPDDASTDAEDQTRQVLSTIDRLLADAGSDRSRLLMATVYLQDLGDYDAMNRVWDAWLAGLAAPPRATVQARLARPDWKIEIVVTAAAGTEPTA